MDRSRSTSPTLFREGAATPDIESAPTSVPPSQIDLSTGPYNEKEQENRDCESDVGAWLCVFASMLFLISSYGFMNSLGTIQSHLALNELDGYSVSQVGWISGTYLFLSLIFNFQIGSILDRYGPQILGPIAAAFSTVTFLLLAECTQYWHFILCLGLFGSIGSGIGAVTAIGVIGKLFTRRRGLAMGIAVMGTSLGGIIYPMMLRATFGKLGWAWSMRLVALVIACITSLGVLCYLPFRRLTEGQQMVQKPQSFSLDLSAFKSLSFVVTALGICMVEFVNYGISGLLPTIARGAGFSTEDGYTLLSILGACSCLGRFSIGFVGDKVGPFNAMITTMFVILVFISSIFVPFSTTSAPLMYTFTALWGYCSGSFYVLSPLCTGKTCEPQDYARYFVQSYELANQMMTRRIVGPLDQRKKLTRCQSCARRRIKCQGGSPCEYCIRMKKHCQPQAAIVSKLKFVSHSTVSQQTTNLQPQISEKPDSVYLKTFFMFLQRCEFTPEFANLGPEFLPLIQTCTPLREATVAIGALEISRAPRARSSDELRSPYHFALKTYSKALKGLQNYIRSSDALHCQGVLWCTLLLGLFELMVEVSGGQWAKHMLYGTSKIFELSETDSRSDYLGSQSFETFKQLEGNRAILYGEDTVLSDYSYPNQHEMVATNPLDEILNLVIKISSFSKSFFDQIELIPENQRHNHPDLDILAAKSCLFQYELQSWHSQHSASIKSCGPYEKLALANYHALQLFLCRNFTFYDCWDSRIIPILTSMEIGRHVASMLSCCSEILEHSHIAGVLVIFPLRMAGANSVDPRERMEVMRLLDLISQKGFVVSERIKVDLVELWEYQYLSSKDGGSS
ncbi:monocarboxylate transporter 2 [Fusarium sp. NRRL 52700]|nr:monocarboxylate transporter 2 [Fusarium sp. NRRL 52700]